MTRIRIIRRHVDSRGTVWQGSQFYTVDDATLAMLIDDGACEIVQDKAMRPELETKAPRKRGRPRKVKPNA